MRILYVDDERSAHINFNYIAEKRNDISSVKYCFDYDAAIQYANDNIIDCAFLDISLPGKNGIELAQQLCSMQPHIELAFVTSYDEFTKEAYKVNGRAYLSKPYPSEEMEKLLDLMYKLIYPAKENVERTYNESVTIYAKTFGNFDLLVNEVPVNFKNAKAKELMAFLVHQMGGTVTNTQIFYALWENQEYTQSTSTYVRRTIRALQSELEQLGIRDILVSQPRSISVDFRKINCDSYELIQGDISVGNRYNGEYMSQYAWGEDMIALLDRVIRKRTI